MNTHSAVTRILCYGDSNTWGKIPGTKPAQRYSAQQRWTGLLQEMLGESYEIVEEGLNSRTTNLEDTTPGKPGRNGLQLFMPILESQHPFDVLLLMLGTNDLKVQYGRSPAEITEGMSALLDEYVIFARKFQIRPSKLLLMSPPYVKEVRPELYAGAEEKSKQLAAHYQRLVEQRRTAGEDIFFLDAAQYAQPSNIDGAHLEEAAHKKLAVGVFEMLKAMNVVR